MSQPPKNELASIFIGALTSLSIGTFLLQALGAFILGITGAFAGWCFTYFISPKLNAWKQKLQKKA